MQLPQTLVSIPPTPVPTSGEVPRKALLIGINYTSHKEGFTLALPLKHYAPLEGSHIDVSCMKDFLKTHRNWPEEAFTVMTDHPDTALGLWPTRENILRELEKLAEEAKPGAHLFLQFSGHGDQIPDQDYDEVDGMDEIIISEDAKIITDDEMHEVLVRKIPAGCKMTVVFDSCSSGTALDLPVFPDKSNFLDTPVELFDSPMSMTYTPLSGSDSNPVYSSTGVSRAARMFDNRFYTDEPDSLPLPLSPQPLILDLPATTLDSLSPYPNSNQTKPAQNPNIRTTGYRPPIRKKYSSGDVVMWSSCRDGESSGEVEAMGADGVGVGISRGAMTHAFIESMKSSEYMSQPTYQNLLDCIRHRIQSYKLREKQHVQLSSSCDIDPERSFDI